MHNQLRAIHHEPLLNEVVNARSMEQLWWASARIQWSYLFTYTQAAYGGGGIAFTVPVGTKRCVVCMLTGKACDRCNLYDWFQRQYCAATGNSQFSAAIAAEIDSMTSVAEAAAADEAVAAATGEEDQKVLTIASARGKEVEANQFQFNGSLFTVTTAFPFSTSERVETLKCMKANTKWLNMGFHDESYLSFYISMIEFLFRFGYAFTTAYAGTAKCRALRRVAGMEVGHVCPLPMECYYCQLVQQYVNHARSMCPEKEWGRVKSIVWKETIRVFHAQMESSIYASDVYAAPLKKVFMTRMVDQMAHLNPTGATAASSSSSAAAAAAAAVEVPASSLTIHSSFAYNAKLPARPPLTAAAAIEDIMTQFIDPQPLSKKRKSNAAATKALPESTDHKTPDAIRKAIQTDDEGLCLREGGDKWVCVLRFTVDRFVRPDVSIALVQPIWDAYVIEVMDRFVRTAGFDLACDAEPWPFSPDEKFPIDMEKLGQVSFLTRAKWAIRLLEKKVVDTDANLLAFGRLLPDHPRLRCLSNRYTWHVMTQLLPHLPSAFRRFQQSAPIPFAATWVVSAAELTF